MTARAEPVSVFDQTLGLTDAVHDRLRPMLTAFFRRRIVQSHEIDDLIQEVFLRIVRRGGLGEQDNLSAYAFRTAQSVLLDRARYHRSHRSAAHVEFDADLHAGSEDATETFLVRETLKEAALALRKLPQRTQHVFILRRVDGFSMNEIAEHLGISLSSAEKHLRRAALHLVKTRSRSQ